MNRYTHSKMIGQRAEQIFMDICIEEGKEVVLSSKHQNMYDHIDMFVDGQSVDVKANRKPDSVWLEATNVRGNNGWLRSKVTFIAMMFPDGFRIFNRQELFDWALVNVRGFTKSNKDYGKWYTRPGRFDLIAQVKLEDINHMTQKFYKL